MTLWSVASFASSEQYGDGAPSGQDRHRRCWIETVFKVAITLLFTSSVPDLLTKTSLLQQRHCRAGTPTTRSCSSAAAMKLPRSWPADPEVWFIRVESQFIRSRITNQSSQFSWLPYSRFPSHFVLRPSSNKRARENWQRPSSWHSTIRIDASASPRWR